MRTVASALAWDLWQRNLGSWLGCGIGLAGATVLAWTARWMQTGTDTAATVGYLALVAGLFVCFGCLHFTEGGRRGGFGTFPIRLFHLPVSTKQLVAWPMVHGAAVVAGWYLVVAWLVLAPLDRRPPCLWPCLYLVSGMTWFQAIVWAFPGSRYGKLALLCLVASGLAFGWMFFLPHMIEGTLADWGYTGPVATVQGGLVGGLALSVPAAFGVGWARISRQRRGERPMRVRGGGAGKTEAVWVSAVKPKATPARKPHRSPASALFFWEWRQTGWLLPVGVAVLLVLTAGVAAMEAPMGAKGTRGLAIWLAVAPCLLAAGLGTGFAKPDFWSEDLRIPTYHAVRPVTAGTWVLAKFRVAVGSVLLTWLLVGVVGGTVLAGAGDPGEVASWLETWRTRYPADRGLAGGVAVVGIAGMLTCRLLVQNAWASLSGRKLWHRVVGAATGAVMLVHFVALISSDGAPATAPMLASSDGEVASNPSHLDALWPSGTAELLLIGIFAKAAVAAWAWIRADQRGWFTFREIATYFGIWVGGTALAALGPLLLFPDAPATRAVGGLACLLLVPLAGPALAARALEANRRGG